MPYSLTPCENDKYLHYYFSGNFNQGDVKGFWKDITGFLEEKHSDRLLLEEKPGTEGQLDTMEIFEAVNLLANTIHMKGVKIAILYLEGVKEETFRQAKFGENVAFNRGLQLNIFCSKQKAEEWLLS